MTSSTDPGTPASKLRPFQRDILLVAAIMLALFTLGIVAGIAMRTFEVGTLSTRGAVAGALSLVIAAASASFAHRLYRDKAAEPRAPSVQKSHRALVLSLLLGIALGILLSVGAARGSGPSMFSNASIPPLIAAIGIFIWLLCTPALTWWWYRTVDEHARRSYDSAALIAFYLFIFTAPSWWLGWRGGFLPAPDTMLLFLATLIVWSAAWLWRRYR